MANQWTTGSVKTDIGIVSKVDVSKTIMMAAVDVEVELVEVVAATVTTDILVALLSMQTLSK